MLSALRCVRCHILKCEDVYAYCPACLRQMCSGLDVAEISAAAREIDAHEVVREIYPSDESMNYPEV